MDVIIIIIAAGVYRIHCIPHFYITGVVYLFYFLCNDNVRNLGSLRLS